MSRIPLLLLSCAAMVRAQTPKNPFDKAPPNVDDALRARVQEFYQDHVEGKYRKAEQIVAEDSKDGFYAANKPALESFKVGDIAYSGNYRKAKVTVVGKMMMTFLGMGAPKMMDVPFPSYWKIEGGKWCWYIYSDPNRMTPFGKANPATGAKAPSVADPAQGFKMPDVDSVRTSVQADRTSVKLPRSAGAEEKVTVSNALPGTVTLKFDQTEFPGLEVKMDKAELRAGEKAVITIRTGTAKDYLPATVRILVQPINQAIDLHISY